MPIRDYPSFTRRRAQLTKHACIMLRRMKGSKTSVTRFVLLRAIELECISASTSSTVAIDAYFLFALQVPASFYDEKVRLQHL